MAGRSSARPRGVVAALVSMAVAALVAGCGDGGDPAATPSGVTSSASATASPSETETAATATASPTETSALPPLPDAAKENTPEGAEAFIRYYFDVVNQAYLQPTPGVLPALADPGCQSCMSIESQVVEMASQGQRARTRAYEILSMTRVGGSIDGVTTFNMDVNLPANAIVNGSGATVTESAAATYSGEGAAVWQGDSWLLYGLNLQP